MSLLSQYSTGLFKRDLGLKYLKFALISHMCHSGSTAPHGLHPRDFGAVNIRYKAESAEIYPCYNYSGRDYIVLREFSPPCTYKQPALCPF
jgi:hypothetical protein